MNKPKSLLARTPFEWSLLLRRLDLPPSQRKIKLVGYTLATYADFDDGKNVRPGLARLARDTGYSERWVQESLRILRDNWLLHRHHKGSNTGKFNLVDIYQLCAPNDWETRFRFTAEREAEVSVDEFAPR